MKLYAKVALGVALAFSLLFVTMALVKRHYVDPAREGLLREASAPGLELAAHEVAASPDRDTAVRRLAPRFAPPLVLAPRAPDHAGGWFERGDAMYMVREVDPATSLVLGPFPRLDPAPFHVGAIVIATALVLAGAVAFALVAPLVRRLRALATTTRRLADGDFAARSTDVSTDALGDLARRFNDMAAQIESLLEGKRQLLQAVSHEFRTPLARLRFELELLESSADTAEHARRLAAIDASLGELDDLVGELMTYTQFDGRQPNFVLETVAPADIAREIAAGVRPLRGDIDVRVVERAPVVIDAHPKYLRRAIQNLVVNALRHARHEVVVEIDRGERAVTVEVRDDGPGIPEAARERVFEPFVRLDDSRCRDAGGVGLGLAIVRRICEWHGGSVAALASDEGARLVIAWPPPSRPDENLEHG